MVSQLSKLRTNGDILITDDDDGFVIAKLMNEGSRVDLQALAQAWNDAPRLKTANEALLKAAKTALAIHDRYCDRVGAADSWAHDVRSQLEDAIALAEAQP